MNKTNVTSNVDESKSSVYSGEYVLSNTLATLFIIFGTASNASVIISLLKYSSKKLREEATTKFIINLALSDLIFAAIVLPMDRLQFVKTDDYSSANLLCKIQSTLFYWTFLLSMFSLTLVSVNRLILIVYNHVYKQVYTNKNIWVMIICSWTLALVLALIPFFELWGLYKLDEKQRTWCGIRRSDERKPNSSARDFFFIFGFALPGLSMIFTYGMIWYKVIHHDSSFKSNRSSQRNFKLFQLIVVIFGAFLICYLPNLLIRAILKRRGYGYLKAIGIILIWCNCCVNPIIYFSFNAEYRYALERLLGFRLTRKPHSPPSSQQTDETGVSTHPRIAATQAKSTV